MGNAKKMKTTYIILFGLFLFLTCCKTKTNQDRKYYVESKPTFFDLHNGDWLTNKWIRKPENLLTIHETFKKVGYANITGNFLSDNPIIIHDLFINKKGYDLVDSLVLTYKNRINGTKYYNEFWSRREKEKNDSIVFIILRDIQSSYKTKMASGILQLQGKSLSLNDTLRQLLEIEFRYDTLTEELARQDFETLKGLGFHQSAYNLLFEIYKYQDLKWDRDNLVKTLQPSNTYIKPWFLDDTK